jgi:hypothetical protein
MTMAPISAVDNVVAWIVAKNNLVFGMLAAPAVGGLTEPSAELLRSFAKETLADTVRLLAFDCTDSWDWRQCLVPTLALSRLGFDWLFNKQLKGNYYPLINSIYFYTTNSLAPS